MAPLSSTLAWEIPWTEEPGRLQSMGSLRVRHDWVTSLSLFTFMHWRRKWHPTPVFLPGESQGWEPSGLPSMGSHRVVHDWSDLAAVAANISVIRELEGKEIDMGKNSKKNNSRIFSTFVKNISWQIKDALWTPSTVNRHTEKVHTIKLLKTNDKGKILRTEKNIAEEPKDLLITSHQKWWKPENNGMRSLSC